MEFLGESYQDLQHLARGTQPLNQVLVMCVMYQQLLNILNQLSLKFEIKYQSLSPGSQPLSYLLGMCVLS